MGVYKGIMKRLVGTCGEHRGFTVLAIAVAILLAGAFFLVAYPVAADDPFTTRPHEWTARQNIWKALNFKKGSTVTNEVGSVINLAHPGTGVTGIPVQAFDQDAVIIDNKAKLSTWSGTATAGQSYFQTEPGKRYIVDLYAIKASGMTGSFSGVTAVLPNAALYPESVVKIEMAITGATGYPQWAAQAAGVTALVVVPYPGTGTTYYGMSAPPQTMRSYRLIAGEAPGNLGMASGATFWSLDFPGESAAFALAKSSVSAYPLSVYVTN